MKLNGLVIMISKFSCHVLFAKSNAVGYEIRDLVHCEEYQMVGAYMVRKRTRDEMKIQITQK